MEAGTFMPHRPARDICVSALISIAAGWGCCCATPAIAAAVAPGCADHNPVPCERSSSPYNWQSVKIVDGGVMPGIYTHPTEPGLMYIRANVGGAYRWNAATSLWIPLTDWLDGTNADWSLMGIESIALDPTDPDRLYLAAGMYIESWITINGAILISRNQGRTFDRVNLPFKLGGNDDYGQQGGERLAVNPFQPNQLYLGTHENGLWLSSDYGAPSPSWATISTPINPSAGARSSTTATSSSSASPTRTRPSTTGSTSCGPAPIWARSSSASRRAVSGTLTLIAGRTRSPP